MEIEVAFKSSLGQDWAVPGSYSVSTNSNKEDLQEIVLHVVSKKASLMFTLNSIPLTSSLQEYLIYSLLSAENLSTEVKIELEFFLEIPPLLSSQTEPSSDWISSISIHKSQILAGNYSGLLQTWQNSSGLSDPCSFPLFSFPLKSFSINSQTNSLVAVSKKGDIKLLSSDLSPIASGSTEHLEKVAWNPPGSHFATGSYSGKLQICSLSLNAPAYIQTNLKRQQISENSISFTPISTSHTDLVSGVHWPSIESLITSSFDHSILMIDLEQDKTSSSVLCPKAVQCSEVIQGITVAGFENGSVYLYDLRTAAKVGGSDGREWVRCVKALGNAVVVGCEDGEVKVFDLRAFKAPCCKVAAHSGKVMALDLDKDQVVSGGADSKVHLFRFS